MRQINVRIEDDTHAYLAEQGSRGRVPMGQVIDILAAHARRLGWQLSERPLPSIDPGRAGDNG